MSNLVIYYNRILRPQFILKYPDQYIQDLQFLIHRIIIEVNIRQMKKGFYYIPLYNMVLLIRLMCNKHTYIRRVIRKHFVRKVYLGGTIRGMAVFTFFDMISNFILPIFESFNVNLDFNGFDMFGNITYNLIYCDPIFTSKNIITVWSPTSAVSIKFIFSTGDKEINYSILQNFKLKWYN